MMCTSQNPGVYQALARLRAFGSIVAVAVDNEGDRHWRVDAMKFQPSRNKYCNLCVRVPMKAVGQDHFDAITASRIGRGVPEAQALVDAVIVQSVDLDAIISMLRQEWAAFDQPPLPHLPFQMVAQLAPWSPPPPQPTMAEVADERFSIGDALDLLEPDRFVSPPPKGAPSEQTTAEQTRTLAPRFLFDSPPSASSSAATTATPPSTATATAAATVASALFANATSSLAPTEIVRYEPAAPTLPNVEHMLRWIRAMPRVDGVDKTDEAALRASTVFAATDAAGYLVAFAALALSTPYLLELHVHQDWRRCGFGSRLLALVKDAAAAAKPGGRLRLTVEDGNSPAIRLYIEAGFNKLVGEEGEEGYSIFEYSLA